MSKEDDIETPEDDDLVEGADDIAEDIDLDPDDDELDGEDDLGEEEVIGEDFSVTDDATEVAAGDDDDDDLDEARPRARRTEPEPEPEPEAEADDDDDEADPEDVEADLDEILRDRLASSDDDDDEDDDPNDGVKPSEVAKQRSDEFVCGTCFLVVSRAQIKVPCPMGDGIELHQPLG